MKSLKLNIKFETRLLTIFEECKLDARLYFKSSIQIAKIMRQDEGI